MTLAAAASERPGGKNCNRFGNRGRLRSCFVLTYILLCKAMCIFFLTGLLIWLIYSFFETIYLNPNSSFFFSAYRHETFYNVHCHVTKWWSIFIQVCIETFKVTPKFSPDQEHSKLISNLTASSFEFHNLNLNVNQGHAAEIWDLVCTLKTNSFPERICWHNLWKLKTQES